MWLMFIGSFVDNESIKIYNNANKYFKHLFVYNKRNESILIYDICHNNL